MKSEPLLNETTGPCILPQDISEIQWIFYYDFVWWLEYFGAVFIGSLGIVFNVITIVVLLSTELASSFFNWLLVCLAVFDSFLLLSGILEALRNHIGSTELHTYIFVVFLYPFRSVVMCCSIYTTVMLALERYHALVSPKSHFCPHFRSGRQSLKSYFNFHSRRLLKYIAPIVIFSTIYCIPKMLELDVKTHHTCLKDGTNNTCSYRYEILVTELRRNNHYTMWYLNISNILTTTIIPLASLTYLNVNIYLKFKEYLRRQASSLTLGTRHAQEKIKKREKDMVQQTRILFSIVILFGLFHILRIVLNLEECLNLEERKFAKEKQCEWLQYWTIIASPISHLMLQTNSSVNFLIYCYFNKSFRAELTSSLAIILAFFKIKGCINDTIITDQDTRNNAMPNTIPLEMANIEDIELVERTSSSV